MDSRSAADSLSEALGGGRRGKRLVARCARSRSQLRSGERDSRGKTCPSLAAFPEAQREDGGIDADGYRAECATDMG